MHDADPAQRLEDNGELGSRFLFLEMPDGEHSNDELVDSVAGGQSYMARVKVCREEVASFLETLWMDTGGVRGVRWDRGADPRSVMLQIAAYAKVLARLRGTISVWREGSGDDETYNFSTPMIEQPHRAMSLLYALARGHALVHGRRQLSEEDLPLVARAALESTPNDRRAVMRLLLAKEGVVSTADVQEALRCSAPTGRAILETLEKLGIGEFVNPGPPAAGTLTLDEPLRWLLEPIESELTPCASGIEKKPTPCASEGLAEALCLICELRPVVGGPCSLRCAECREKAAA